MKRYLLALIFVIELLGVLFILNAIRADNSLKEDFANSGYILKYEENEEKYYFADNTKYKKSYQDQVVFKNTDGEQITLNKDNFIHYDNGAISSFTKGVLVDINTIDSDPITYYNFSANKVLRKFK